MVLVLTLGFVAFSGVWGIGVFDALSDDSSLDNPASESQRINERVLAEVGPQHTDFIALYSSDTLSVEDPQFRGAVEAVATRLQASPAVAEVNSYYSTGSPSMVSTDKRQTYLAIRLSSEASDDDETEIRDNLAATGLRTQVGGQTAVDLDIDGQIPSDIARAEMIAMPILLLLLLVVFGSVVAALMPVLIGAVAVLGAFALVRVITMFTDVSIFSINIITILGLGLAVDYGLFIVSRFRDELDANASVEQALARTMATAGRTVVVSGVLVMLALSSLMIFPQVLLRSMGLGGAAAVLVAMVASLTVLPALLAVLGHRVNALRLPWARKRGVASVTGAVAAGAGRALQDGRWARIAGQVMRRPVLYLIGVVALLAVLTMPFLGIRFGGIDERMLPPGTESQVVSARLAADFPNGTIRPIRVLISSAAPEAAAAFRQQVDSVPGVTDIAVAAQQGGSTLLTVSYAGDASSEPARQIVSSIRDLPAPPGAQVMVGGSTASVMDQLDSLTERLPWMALLVALITFVVLTVAFGSVVVPLKAIVMNVVSLGAAFGAVTWIFQDGHLSGLFNFIPTGYVESSQPILMVAILFGLSMDYEVFLLSRVRENWDELGDNTEAVKSGVQHTGWLISTAAVLLCVVVGSFATSGITFIKMIGVGMVVALLVDATLVRLILVPATMRLLGRYNWWAPSFVQALYGRYGVKETLPPQEATEPTARPESDLALHRH
ncbi:MAG TPA: MMPL family transporter [Jatrophihabitans sp.]|uniref:MMPL family transporter n=1 Tax=Jatrophihabitans sp. TaxID=1932789 RepID=UPI002F0AB14A